MRHSTRRLAQQARNAASGLALRRHLPAELAMPGQMPRGSAIGRLEDEALPGDVVADVEAIENCASCGPAPPPDKRPWAWLPRPRPVAPLALQAGGTVEGVRQHSGTPPHLVQEAGAVRGKAGVDETRALGCAQTQRQAPLQQLPRTFDA